MENELKKHIEKIKKRDSKRKFESSFSMEDWLFNTIATWDNKSYFPRNNSEKDLFDLLTLEVSYKQTVKSLCDMDHQLIFDLLIDLEISNPNAEQLIKSIKLINNEPLAFYLLFQEEVVKSEFKLGLVIEVIDKLAIDSSQGTVISHSAKMSNPACKVPKIYCKAEYTDDGFIRTGNSFSHFDMHINATKLKVFKFLSLKYRGHTLLEYVYNKNYEVFQKLFCVEEERAQKWVKGFLSVRDSQVQNTDRYVKQVYFPLSSDNYHMLSILSPSGLVFSLKEKINFINDYDTFSYTGKKLKKQGKYSANKFSKILNLTVTRHGGDHPKNISGLNNKYQSYYLLMSAPPALQNRTIHFPKTDFFIESFNRWECKETIYALHKLFKTNYNNHKIREGRDYRIQEFVDKVIKKMWEIRAIEQPHLDTSQLKQHQKIWLLAEHKQTREEKDEWLNTLIKQMSSWLIRNYEKLLGKQAIKLSDEELHHFQKVISENKEALR